MDLVLSSRFLVVFLHGGAGINTVDIRFQRVSGLASTVETTQVNQGGENRFTSRLPRRIDHGNLILERGFVVGSLLNFEFNTAMTLFQFAPSNVLVSVLDAEGAPLAAWTFVRAFPVRWATADLSATEDRVLIDTLELSYEYMLTMRV
jgi:phage tail-like protein